MILLILLLIIGGLLIQINKRYIILVVCALFAFFYCHLNKKNPVLYSKNDNLYIDSKDNVIEFFETSTSIPSSTPMLTQTCSPSKSLAILMGTEHSRLFDDFLDTEDIFNEKIEDFKKYIKDNNNNNKICVTNNLKKNYNFVFMPKKNVYNISHSHKTIGELVYHLKSLDNNLFLQVYNGFYNPKNQDGEFVLDKIFAKMESIYIKKGYLNISDEDKLGQKINIIYHILKVIKDKFDEPSVKNNFSQSNDFKESENCNKITIEHGSLPYNKETIGCPKGSYIKGIDFKNNNNNYQNTLTCCELNNTELDYNESQNETDKNDYFPTNLYISDYGDENILNNIKIRTEETDMLGNYITDDNDETNLIYKNKSFKKISIDDSEINANSDYQLSGLYIKTDRTINDRYVWVNLDDERIEIKWDTMINKWVLKSKNEDSYIFYNNNTDYLLPITNWELKENLINTVDTSLTPNGTTSNGTTSNGTTPNGTTPNGTTPNGTTSNGTTSNGTTPNGTTPNGTTPNGTTPNITHTETNIITIENYFTNTSPEFSNIYSTNAPITYKPESTATCTGSNIDKPMDKIIDTYLKIINSRNLSGVYKYKGTLNRGRPVYKNINNSNIEIIYEIDRDRDSGPKWIIRDRNNVLDSHNNNNKYHLEPPRNNWEKIRFKQNLKCSIKSYEIKNHKNNVLGPKLDLFSKLFHLHKLKNSSEKIIKFILLKKNNYYYIKSTYLSDLSKNDMFLSIDNLGNVIFNKTGSKFQIIKNKNKNKYVIKQLHENKLLTFELNKVILKTSISIADPLETQLFNLETQNEESTKNITQIGYYSITGGQYGDVRPDVKQGESIMCNDNEYLSKIEGVSGTTNIPNNININVKGTCVKINPESNNNNNIIRFFNTKVEEFTHTHDFLANDILHKTNIDKLPSSLRNNMNFIDKESSNNLELYSREENLYLNEISDFDAKEKIFITMLMLYNNGIKDVNINYKSIYKFFKRQMDQKNQYSKLMEATVAPSTVAPVTVAPVTVAPVTVAPSTVAPANVAPVTVAPSTVAPANVAPATVESL